MCGVPPIAPCYMHMSELPGVAPIVKFLTQLISFL